MSWKLTNETDVVRTYMNATTGTELETRVIVTDKLGRRWWGFSDLFKIPYIRIAYSKQITDLFTAGMTVEDLKNWIAKGKALLKTNDPDRYEKSYALYLEQEALVNATVDPLRQHLSLCTIYILGDRERIDYFDMKIAEEKMKAWALDTDCVSFFLNWHTNNIQSFMQDLNNTSRIASELKGMAENKVLPT